MKENNVRKNALNALLLVIIVSLIGLTAYVSMSIVNTLSEDNNYYVEKDIVDKEVVVNKEIESVLEYPYTDTNVKVSINYYDFKDDKKEQERSLIEYDNTYLPNTGILYTNENKFDVVSIFDGTVTKVSESPLFGKQVEITYNNNIVALYSSLDNVVVKEGDSVSAKDIIATSGINKISSESKNMLLFELIINGTNVDPNTYYNKSLKEMI